MKEYLEPDRPVSLYIHIPFCTTKCGYCAFYSIPESQCDSRLYDRFYDTLMRQLEALTDELARPFETVYVGGGNPGLLGPERLGRIISLAQKNGKAKECSFEINPETLDESFASLAGLVDRISTGIQSFDGEALSILQRNAGEKECERALDLLKTLRDENGIRFNADIMTNIPHVDIRKSVEDIQRIATWEPDHISLYSLTFEEGTRLVESEHPLDEDTEADNLVLLWDELEKLGYEHYEVSAFAKDGQYCMHNLVYWSLGQYIGLGPSAESSVGWRKVVSSREKETVEEYLASPSFDSVMLSEEETIEEYLMTGLRTKWGIDRHLFDSRFSKTFNSLFEKRISNLDGALYRDDGRFFSLTRDGIMVLNHILLELLV